MYIFSLVNLRNVVRPNELKFSLIDFYIIFYNQYNSHIFLSNIKNIYDTLLTKIKT